MREIESARQHSHRWRTDAVAPALQIQSLEAQAKQKGEQVCSPFNLPAHERMHFSQATRWSCFGDGHLASVSVPRLRPQSIGVTSRGKHVT